MNTGRSHISSAISCLQVICTFVPHHHVVVLNLRCRRSCHNAKRKFAHGSGAVGHDGDKYRRSPEACCEDLSQYDNDEKTWLEFRFKLENYLTLVDERCVGTPSWTQSPQPVANLPTGTEESAVTIRTLSPHIVRLAGDTDHWTKLETGAKIAEPETGSKAWRTDGGPRNAPKKTAGRRFAMLQSCATTWNE